MMTTRTLKILAATAATAGALMIAVPASAQVEIGVPGVGVRIGDYHHRHYHRAYPSTYYDTGYRTYPQRVIYDDDDDCTWRMVERERPDGTVVTVRERDCD